MDAISRLQTQAQCDTAALEIHRRNLVDLTQAVSRLSNDMVWVDNLVITLKRELQVRPTPSLAPIQATSGSGVNDAILENFASSISDLTSKVSEVDELRTQLEIVKRRIRIMEGAVRTAAPPNNVAPLQLGGPAKSSREKIQTHPPHQMRHGSQQGFAPPSVPPHHRTCYPQASSRGFIQAPSPHIMTNQSGQRSQNDSSASASASRKKQYSDSADQHMDTRSGDFGLPKRASPVPLHPYTRPEPAPIPTPMRYSLFEADKRDDHVEAARVQEKQQGLVSRPAFVQRDLGKQSHFEDCGDSGSSNLLLPTSKKSRCSRGSGRGYRSQSLPTNFRRFQAPEWGSFQDHRKAVIGSFSNGSFRGGCVMRRGPDSNDSIMKRPVAETRKTRSKPIRNADGILIRKDGTPDMRSRRKNRGVL